MGVLCFIFPLLFTENIQDTPRTQSIKPCKSIRERLLKVKKIYLDTCRCQDN